MKLSGSSALRWSLPFVGAAAILLLLLAPLGLGHTAWARAVENAFHAPLCALIAIGLVIWLRQVAGVKSVRTQYRVALLGAVALGAIGELAQSFTDVRHAQWIDLANDFLGALAGLSAFSLFDRHRPAGAGSRYVAFLVVAVALGLVLAPVAQIAFMYWQRWQQLPELATWGSPSGHHFVTSTSAELRVVKIPLGMDADVRLALQVKPLRESRWVGVAIDEPWPKWAGYSHLAIEVVNPNDYALSLYLRINDREHNNHFDDRFNRSYTVAPHVSAVFKVPLSEVQQGPKHRQIDLNAIAQVILFQDATQGASSFYLRGARLEH